MKNWYMYYCLLRSIRGSGLSLHSLTAFQDALTELRERATREWPGATGQDIQDFYGSLADNPTIFSEREARHLTLMEPWADEEVSIS